MDLLAKIRAEFGEAVACEAAGAGDVVDGVAPQVVAAPRDEAAAQALVHWCGRENIAFVPRGGGSKLHIGAPPARCDLIISTKNLNAIVEHDEGNATVQVGSGITINALDKVMRERRQFVPLANDARARNDVGRSTVGGVVATNYYNANKLKYGAPRDLVTGLHAVLSDGRLVKAGSKVVKNVSGYDLNKIFIGSFGTLGLITEVTFRLRPESERMDGWASGFDSWEAIEARAWSIVNGPFEPTALTVHWDDRAGAALTADFEGGEASVAGQLKNLPAPGDYLNYIWNIDEVQVCLRAHLPLQAASQWAQLARANQPDEILWECGLGVVRAYFAKHTPDIAALRAAAEQLGGFLIVEKAPAAIKTPDLVWGAPHSDFALMKKLKASFDAANVCVPGRFVGGL